MSKEIRKIGSNIDLKGLVIHQVVKNSGIRQATIKHAKQLLRIEEKEKVFIAKIYKSYFDNSKPYYGIFANENPKFKDQLSSYLSYPDFYSFSKSATEHYKQVIGNSPPATGGFLIFAHFTNTDKNFDYMLVMTTTNKDGFVVSETDLTIQDIKNLDLSKIDVACIINLTKWINIENKQDLDSSTYLSFAKGNKDISYYFMSFIDCDNKTTKTESTNRLIRAIDSYCTDRGYEREDKIRKRNEIYSYCLGSLESKKEIQLSAISSLMNVEDPHDFEKYAADEKFGVSAIINGDKAKLRPMKFVTYKDKSMTVEFDAGLIKDGKVVYSPQKKQLTFKDVPDKLASQIPL
jgi:nucleoid-associated protein